MIDIETTDMDFVLIWDSSNYDRKVLVLNNYEAVQFITKDKGFSEEDISQIFSLRNGSAHYSSDGFSAVRL